MTASLDPKPIPSHAFPIWSDGKTIFCAIPSKAQGIPTYIAKFPHTTSGLANALKLLGTKSALIPATVLRATDPPRVGTITQQIAAREILQKFGVIK